MFGLNESECLVNVQLQYMSMLRNEEKKIFFFDYDFTYQIVSSSQSTRSKKREKRNRQKNLMSRTYCEEKIWIKHLKVHKKKHSTYVT